MSAVIKEYSDLLSDLQKNNWQGYQVLTFTIPANSIKEFSENGTDIKFLAFSHINFSISLNGGDYMPQPSFYLLNPSMPFYKFAIKNSGGDLIITFILINNPFSLPIYVIK